MSQDRGWTSTHEWITFQFDASTLPLPTWILLGECASKIEHISGSALRPATQRQLNRLFLAKGVQATTAIEGNTLTEEQVRQRLDGDLELPKSQEYLGQEIDNVIEAYSWLEQRIRRGAGLEVLPDDLKYLNRTVLKKLDLDPDVVPGEYPQHVVVVGDYRSPDPIHTGELLNALCQWLNDDVWQGTVGSHFVLPILKAILAHLYIAWIHPFGDGNGRTARLVEFDVLARAGVPTDSAHLLSNHYNLTRVAYYLALSRARRDPVEFVTYAVQGFADGLREQIRLIERQQLDVAWRDFVHQVFDEEPRTTARWRRRELVLALTRRSDPVPVAQVPSLSPALAAAYVDKTRKTLSRDINALISKRLVMRTTGGVIANISIMRAFMPLVNPGPVNPVADNR